ncbi:polysaccharide pyruvyl transferase family protein [Pseudoalteromonas agarivorans]|uniref:polysaccharide pyruvyl transferase family protein n=1 Tax=Pseudoalteromonas TaxID=53246 RepID=UPI000F759309|nr:MULTISPECIES: polysaccharide pyruvyl transferase family protein [Pseudoalteromonas]AZN31577.1 polysaccharide pyruvyl transferase family protein [Pseudoalteromonas sp. Xi13]MCQ8822208.1 polysaccharide pyruvyl transferase family protein [Pseudoalteromonas agarivorans]
MKIGILTQHLHNNYGGLLQAFALQYYLKNQGHDVLTIDFTTDNIGATVNKKSRTSEVKNIIYYYIRKYILRRNIKSIFPVSDEVKANIGKETSRFVAENIRTTQKLTSIEQLKYLDSYKFDAYVVGSDQVWRPRYSPGLPAFFLDFLKDDKKTKRLSYAASFGTDNCDEYSPTELIEFSSLLKKFNGISVREDSAVELCNKHFDVSVEQVLDPTMLLAKEDYIELVKKDKIAKSDGNMMVYVLDQSPEKVEMIDKVAKTKNLTPFTVMPSDETGIYPPVTKWLRGFMDAEYIVTDSFHGVAFSILFNKQFIAIGNKSRGIARFTSILKKFDLESRLLINASDLNDSILDEVINYSLVNDLLSKEQTYASNFLKKNLSN